MSAIKFKKGPKLFSVARKKALRLDIPQEKGVNLAELINRIQIKEKVMNRVFDRGVPAQSFPVAGRHPVK